MSARKEFVRGAGTVVVTARHVRDALWSVRIGDEAREVEARRLADGRLRITIDGRAFDADCAPCGDQLQVRVDGRTHLLAAAGARARAAEPASGVIEAPMTGTIQKVLRHQGDEVATGDVLIVLTAMKMEHRLTAAVGGVLVELHAVPGQAVESGMLLARIEPKS